MITATCQYCGIEFETRDDKKRGRGKYCSRLCYEKHWIESIGPELKSRNRKRVKRICQTCGIEFEIIPSWTKSKGGGKYCSYECLNIAKTKVRGINHPLHKEPAHKICQYCGKEYTTKPSLSKRSRFCSRQCQGCWQSQNMHSPTSIEIAVKNMLNDLHLTFIEQAQLGQYLFDFLIPDNKLVIEADGTYWHSLPHQKANDKRKDSYLSHHGYDILRLSESLINTSPEACKFMIFNRLMR